MTTTTENNVANNNTNNANTVDPFAARAVETGQVPPVVEVVKSYPFHGSRVSVTKTTDNGRVYFDAKCGKKSARSWASATIAERSLLRQIKRRR
ncbi:MAG: hypothetical protein OEY01_03340 [Desulfobulbaceae bacterium]|nr:hypothetical protein [Desulfobulbaceae bacterium]